MNQITTGWSEGKTQTTSVSSSNTTSLDIKPGEHIEVFIIQTKQWLQVPYTMKGYYLKDSGGKEKATETSTCTFSNFSKTAVYSQDVKANSEPVLLKIIE